MLEPSQAEPFLSSATAPQAFDNAQEKLIASTGNRELDDALALTLSRLTEVFGVLPGFSFFDDYDSRTPQSPRRDPDWPELRLSQLGAIVGCTGA